MISGVATIVAASDAERHATTDVKAGSGRTGSPAQVQRRQLLLVLPIDTLVLLLSFVPVQHLMTHVLTVSQRMADITRCDAFWEAQWRLYLSSVVEGRMSRSAMPLPLLVQQEPRQQPACAPSGASRLRNAQTRGGTEPARGSSRGGSASPATDSSDDGDDRTSSGHEEGAPPLEQLGVSRGSEEAVVMLPPLVLVEPVCMPSRSDDGRDARADDISGVLEDWGQETLRRDAQRALVFLQRRAAMIDNVSVFRLTVISDGGSRPGTAAECRAFALRFCDMAQKAWRMCMRHSYTAKPQSESVGREDVGAERGGNGGDPSTDAEGVLASIDLLAHHDGADVPERFVAASSASLLGDEGGSPVGATRSSPVSKPPGFSQAHILTYYFLLAHCSFSDVNQHRWDDEEKQAICSRIISPTGRCAELRFFLSSLCGPYPRVYVRCICTEGDLPKTVMRDRFDNEVGLETLFYGGYGRVEVDIRPAVVRRGFDALRSILQLPLDFPGELLWNVVVFASGGYGLLQEYTPSFRTYYSSTFVDAMRASLVNTL